MIDALLFVGYCAMAVGVVLLLTAIALGRWSR
jgi:hypothetical protein